MAARLASLTAGFCLLFAPFAVYGEVIDQVLAVVDGDPILQSDLNSLIADEFEYRLQQAGQRNAQDLYQELLRDALDEAIDNKILLRLARQRVGMNPNLAISDEEIDESIREIQKNYENLDAFYSDLEESGQTMNDLRQIVRENIMARRMALGIRRSFEQEAMVTESDVAQYYEDNIDEFRHPERVRLRQIFLEAGEDEGERAKVRGRMEQLREELEAGADFSELAKAYSEAIGAEEGGLIGWTAPGDLVGELNDAAFALEAGEISGVIESRGGFHILKVDERQDAGLAELEEVRTEIEPLIRTQKADERYRDWIAERREESRVQVFL